MGRIIKLVSDNVGRQGYLLFADVSHLTDINSGYGHEAGDEALITAARELSRVFGDENPLGRIGDDEFISVIFSDSYDMIESIKNSVKKGLDEYNKNSERPYCIDIALDAHPFVCEKNMDVARLIGEAGNIMEAKLKPEGGLRVKTK